MYQLISSCMLMLIVALLNNCILAQSPGSKAYPQLDSIRHTIMEKVNKGEAASVSIGILKGGKLIWKESFGWANTEKNIKATPETVYPLASLTKSITSTAAYILASEGKLNMDEAVNKYLHSVNLSYYNCHAEDLKVYHLTNMLGGIPHVVRYYYTNNETTALGVAAQIQTYGFTAYPPGSVFNYSNFSLGIVDQLITDITNMDFADYTKTHLFKPLQMQHTYADKNQIPATENMSTGYNEGKEVPDNRFEPRGGAGAYSCINDLLTYGYFHIHNKIVDGSRQFISSGLFEKMHKPVSILNPYYANGWGVLTIADGTTSLLSNGAIAGCASSLLLIPDKDIVIACLTNSTLGNDFTDNIAFTCADALHPGYMQQLAKLIAKVTPYFDDQPFDTKGIKQGAYTGFIIINQQKIPAAITFDSLGKVTFSIGERDTAVLSDLRTSSNLFLANSTLRVPDSAITKYKRHLSLQLQLSNDKINGIAQAESDESYPLFVIPYYVELKRVE